jgi:Bacterial TSP3 repeat
VLDSGSDSCRGSPADTDGDGWSDASEAMIGTNPNQRCGVNAWPPDITNDGLVDINDIASVANWYARAVPPAASRLDLAPPAPDRLVDIYDLSRQAGLFFTRC